MFIVIEIQITAENVISTLVNTYESRNEAFSKYHLILASAATSALPKHGAVILNDDAVQLAGEVYKHNIEAGN